MRAATRAQIAHIRSLYRTLGREAPAVETRAGAYNAIQHAKRLLADTKAEMRPEPPPTATQLHDLAVLARRAGLDVPTPATCGEAARLLKEMRQPT